MCGKAAVAHLSWQDVFAWATSLTPPSALPADPESRVNISPSRLRRKSEPDSMIWETLPVISHQDGADVPSEAIWPYLPPWSNGGLPTIKGGKTLSTANARLREGSRPFAPTFMGAWSRGFRVVVVVSWFYEFDSRCRPQVPYAVFPLNQPFWAMAGLASPLRSDTEHNQFSVAVITVEPNQVLQSIGHHRSPALLRNSEECSAWLSGNQSDALRLLRPYENELMGVEQVPMNIKIPGNQDVPLPDRLAKRYA
jgi:putative SOS response-associated peptidase YedK